MSDKTSWSRSLSRDFSSESSRSQEIEPTFEQPEYFSRHTKGRRGWYCTICSKADLYQQHSFSPIVAMNHEKTQTHKNNVSASTTWEPVSGWGIDVDNWGPSREPFEQLRASGEQSRLIPLDKRVKRWIRDIAKAEGLEFQEDPDLDVDPPWDPWTAANESLKVDEPPPEEEKPDPRWSADFKFVEKVARKRGLKNERHRLHAFYRLPTDEKITRIQEIVRFIHTH